MTTRIGFYPGSFDPVTRGHTDIIGRALKLVDELVIGIGVHPGKAPLFTAEERIQLLQSECKPLLKAGTHRLRVITFDGLAIETARRLDATVMIRGLRDGTDLDYEMQLAGMNGAMAPGVETVFLPASPMVRHIAANLVRQIAGMGGDVSQFVSKDVAKRLAKRLAEQKN
jgi:pantetheine-phosphate adenylyltransferase